MRHPFDGILGADDRSALDRRTALGVLASSVAAGAAGWTARAAAGEPADEDAPSGDFEHRLWFVIPENVRTFGATRREEFDILGPYQAGLPASEELARARGYFTWSTQERAEWLAAQEGISAVHELTPELKQEMGRPSDINRQLRVSLAPNSWRTRPEKGQYAEAKQIAEGWADAFPADQVKFEIGPGGRYILAKLADGHDPAEIVAAIKGHPQVSMLSWTGTAVTTFAVGEEGATTQALGEEGAVPTTAALGEEGVTTEALGEEGGVTTFALGEEGGGASTRALGEEGGGPRFTTQALGEEGGR